MVQENSITEKAQVVVICGPTASGKSTLAVEVAKILGSCVISADALSVYKKLDVGTAKPTLSEMQGVPHYMIDVVSPEDSFSVGDYRELALPILKDVVKGGQIPVICGGTGFYVDSLLYNYSYGNHGADLIAREKYYSLAKQFGNSYVFDILKEKDYDTAVRLHENDLKRVIRALEICDNGIKKSEISDEKTPVFNYKAFSYDYPRETLYNRINARVDKMIDNGLIREVKALMDEGITIENQCMQGIGYKEVYSYLSGESDYTETIETIKRNSRRYAKRQITYFKKLKDLIYLSPAENESEIKLQAKRITGLL